jgi:hypothetical protein
MLDGFLPYALVWHGVTSCLEEKNRIQPVGARKQLETGCKAAHIGCEMGMSKRTVRIVWN